MRVEGLHLRSHVNHQRCEREIRVCERFDKGIGLASHVLASDMTLHLNLRGSIRG